MLVRLLYASRAAKALNAKTIASILLECQRNNPRRGITGVLCYSDEIFLQVLEGGRDAVCETFNSIVRDGRHETVRLLSFEEISERRFGGWSMGQVNIEKINSSLLLKYAEKAELDPFAVSGKVSMALLEELIATDTVPLACSKVPRLPAMVRVWLVLTPVATDRLVAPADTPATRVLPAVLRVPVSRSCWL